MAAINVVKPMPEDVWTIEDLRLLEERYAAMYWDREMNKWEDLSHLVHHNSKMLGMMSSLCKVGQHFHRVAMKEPKLTEALKRRIVANYLIWAVHYSNVWGIPLMEAFIEKQNSNVSRSKAEENSL